MSVRNCKSLIEKWPMKTNRNFLNLELEMVNKQKIFSLTCNESR